MGSSIQFDMAAIPQMRPVTTAPAIDAPVSPAPPAAETAGIAQESRPITLEQDHLVASYDYREDIHMVVITLRSQDTGEVIQQLPPEQILNLLQGVMEQLGAVVDRKG